MDYSVAEHESIDSAISTIPVDPPHFVVLGGDFVAPTEVRQLLDLCPESHLVAVVEAGRVQEYYPLLTKGLYDVIAWPLHDAHQLVAAIDRGAERDYFMYQNEQIKEQVKSLKTELAQRAEAIAQSEPKTAITLVDELVVSGDTDEGVIEELQNATSEILSATTSGQGVDTYLQTIHRWVQRPVCLFKYLAARRSLFLAMAAGVSLDEHRGLGIDFSREKEGFGAHLLKDPSALPMLRDLVRTTFKVDNFTALPIDEGDSVRSVVVILQGHMGNKTIPTRLLTKVLGAHLSIMALQNRLHSAEQVDPVTQVWNRENFEIKLQQEMSRSRRTHLPLSMIVASVDNFGDLRANTDQETADILMRSLAGMIRRNSRVNDVVGRLNEDEIGLLLAHTGSRGAAIKAERLRRMVEAADFTKVLRRDQGITISLGVSEYPSFCHDGDELLRSADDALFQVKEAGFNKVCMAPLPEGFVADFEVGQR